MMQLILHTEYLLSIHECVIIPGLGGFVGRVSPARFDESVSTWMPPQKELSFNSSLFHNDGLLLGAYAGNYGVTYSEAFVMVEKAVLELKKELSAKNEVQFGRIGTFKYDENKALLFSPAKDLHYFSTGTYGLFPIKITLLNELKKLQVSPVSESAATDKPLPDETIQGAHPQRSSDTIYIPLKKKFVYRVSAAAAIVLLFLFLSTPIYVDTSHKTNYAKLLSPTLSGSDFFSEGNEYFVDKDVLSRNETKEKEIPEPVAVVKEEIIPEPVITEKPTVQTPVVPDVKESGVQLTSNSAGPFYIIIGSFPSTKDAQQFLNGAKTPDLANIGILTKDGRFRVYADSFDNRAEANQYMKQFKAQYGNRHPNAWLYQAK